MKCATDFCVTFDVQALCFPMISHSLANVKMIRFTKAPGLARNAKEKYIVPSSYHYLT